MENTNFFINSEPFFLATSTNKLSEIVSQVENLLKPKNELIESITINSSLVEFNPEREVIVGAGDVLSFQTIKVGKMIKNEIRQGDLHMNSLFELIEDVLPQLKNENMKEIQRLFVMFSSLLQWVVLLTSNINLHLGNKLLELNLIEDFQQIEKELSNGLNMILNFKDQRKMIEMGEYIEQNFISVLKKFQLFLHKLHGI